MQNAAQPSEKACLPRTLGRGGYSQGLKLAPINAEEDLKRLSVSTTFSISFMVTLRRKNTPMATGLIRSSSVRMLLLILGPSRLVHHNGMNMPSRKVARYPCRTSRRLEICDLTWPETSLLPLEPYYIVQFLQQMCKHWC